VFTAKIQLIEHYEKTLVTFCDKIQRAINEIDASQLLV
jgi:hypothetical protein